MPSGLPQGVPPKNSGAKVLLWVLAGIAAFLMLAIVGFSVLGFIVMHKVKQAGIDPELMRRNPALATAKLAVAANPDVEIVSSNDSSGTLVMRDRKNGRLTTMKFDMQKKTMVVIDEQGRESKITADPSSGTLRLQSANETVALGAGADKPPSWVPQYPGSSPEYHFSASADGKQSGSFSFVTGDSLDKVLTYYSDTLTSGGFAATRVGLGSETVSGGIVTGQNKDSGRSVTASATVEQAGTHVTVHFAENQ
jgi:hypothetical protein